MTFIELVRQLRLECGVPGEGPGSVEAARGEHRRLVHFIAEADFSLSALWDDWHFLWRRHELAVSSGSACIARRDFGFDGEYAEPMSEVLARIDLDSLTWAQDGQVLVPVDVCQWPDYRRLYLGAEGTPGMPCIASQRPDGALALAPAPALDGTLSFDYWRRPRRLVHNLDVPLMPAQYHRAIVVQAKMYFAEYEDAPDILQPAAGEFGEWLQRLESDQLPHGGYRRRSELGDAAQAIVVVPQ